MKPEHRSALLSVASRQGHKGFPAVPGEAETYFQEEDQSGKRRVTLVALAGSVKPKAADVLRTPVKTLRENWR
jgi:hypothetical protein